MPRDYFQTLPTVQYDSDGSGNVKLAIDILKRIKVRAEALTDGAVFYNYQMQEGDNPEIIADKYYGSTKYHWVVMLMNDALDHIFDFSLSSSVFERYIIEEYGSVERSFGVTKTISDLDTYESASVFAEWHSTEQNSTSNSIVETGTIPAGNTTAISVTTSASADPFSNIGAGDIVRIFVPETWYNFESNTAVKLAYTQPATVLSKSVRTDTGSGSTRNFVLSTNMNSNTYPEFNWVLPYEPMSEEEEEVIGETVSIRTGIHHFEMDVYDSTGTVLLASKVEITQAQYVNNSIGTTPFNSKRVISNHEYESEKNEDKRNIVLLKKDYLTQFVDEFARLARKIESNA